ncbi:hypothetical protein M8994_16485 [Brucella sp. 21LCYQ03]|nr:hypothetical protein [Brucella sp. 21LCYQ03]
MSFHRNSDHYFSAGCNDPHWASAGSEKVTYGGVQIGLAFTLTVLPGFGPTTDMDTARDRIIGNSRR